MKKLLIIPLSLFPSPCVLLQSRGDFYHLIFLRDTPFGKFEGLNLLPVADMS